MDRLKRERGLVRAQFTRQTTAIGNLLGADPIDKIELSASFTVLGGHRERLLDLNHKVFDVMLDEGIQDNDFAIELESCDKYEADFVRMSKRVEVVFKPEVPYIPQPVSPANSFNGSASNGGRASYKLPKIELQKFGGDLKEWLGWWAHFQPIHDDDTIEDNIKFSYLLQSLEKGSVARKAVECFPPTANNYLKAVDALKGRFGKKDLLLQVYVRELLSLVITNATKKNKMPISELHMKLESYLGALTSLNLAKADPETWLFPLVESSLDQEVLTAWQRSKRSRMVEKEDGKKMTRLESLMEFLKEEVEIEQEISIAQSGFQEVKVSTPQPKAPQKMTEKVKESKVPTTAGLFSGQESGCIFCDGKHDAKDCGKAKSMTIEDKRKKVNEKSACYYCLKTGHTAKRCRKFVQCLVCPKKHLTVMCPEIENVGCKLPSSQPSPQPSVQTSPPSTSTNASQSSVQCTKEVLMKTVLVRVRCKKTDEDATTNHEKVVRLLFDEGSQRSSVSSTLVKELRSKPVGHEMSRDVLADGSVTQMTKVFHHEFTLLSMDGKRYIDLTLREKKRIGGGIPRVPPGPWLNILKEEGVTLTDLSSEKLSRNDIDICIGSEFEGLIKMPNHYRVYEGLVAWQTIFGWTLSGIVSNATAACATINMYCGEESLSKLWNLELLGIKDPITKTSEKEEETAALEVFQKTTTRDSTGRYCVSLPWKASPEDLPSNFKIAERRLQSTIKKLKGRNLVAEYGKLFQDWLAEGFIEKVDGKVDGRSDGWYDGRVDGKENGSKCHYLPHHPVFKESSTTPVRPVFDASCHAVRRPSLNDCLYKGPNCIELLPAVLMRFREKKIGVVADIRKAFQMLDVKREDQDFLRFLWWEESERRLKVYRHRRVVFGVNSSPFLLAAVLNLHFSKEEKRKDIAAILERSMYVDNLVTSVNSFEERDELKKEAVRIMKDAVMDLRQWKSTYEEVQDGDKDESWMTENEVSKVLGLLWNKEEDILSIEVPPMTSSELLSITKRTALSIVSSIFDPLGILSPSTVVPKLIIQQAWIRKTDWDSELEEEDKDKFVKWTSSMNLLSKIQIPRHHSLKGRSTIELHTFCDASKDAYAAVVFLRSEKETKVTVQLIQAKSRVAPYNKDRRPTITRLELMACLIGSRLHEAVRIALDFDDVPSYFWSDSSTAIAWIRRDDQWGTFVGNRVKSILELTKSEQWRHVPGKLNPADLPSRGCTPEDLLSSRWWEGPSWLYDKSEWPVHEPIANEEDVVAERKKTKAAMTNREVVYPFPMTSSSYIKNVKVIGWWKRFIQFLRDRNAVIRCRYLTKQEILKAELTLIRYIQESRSEAADGRNDGKTDGRNMGKRLPTVMGEDGIFRVKTAIMNRDDSEEFLFPIVLPEMTSIEKEPKDSEEEEPVRTSRYGRKLRRPIRYSSYNK